MDGFEPGMGESGSVKDYPKSTQQTRLLQNRLYGDAAKRREMVVVRVKMQHASAKVKDE